MFKEHRLRLTADGHILPRTLSEEDAIILGYDLRARRAALTPHFPDDLRPRFDALLDRLDANTAALEERRRRPTPPADLPQPPEILLTLASVPELQRIGFVNNLEDREVGGLDGLLQIKARGATAQAEAAQRLRAAWFPEGRTFLRLRSRDQWFAVHERFQTLSPAQEADLALLHLRDEVERIQAINAWHGALLRIHAPARPPQEEGTPQLAALLDAVQADMILALALAQLAWGDNPDARELLLGRYLQLLISRPPPRR